MGVPGTRTSAGSTIVTDGLVAVVKRDCPTCVLVAPVLADLARRTDLVVLSQDDPGFPEGVEGVVDDTDLDFSWHHDLDTVPTLLRFETGRGDRPHRGLGPGPVGGVHRRRRPGRPTCPTGGRGAAR